MPYLTLSKGFIFSLESLEKEGRLERLALIELTGRWREQATVEELELIVGEELYIFSIEEFAAQALQGTTAFPINGITLINNPEVIEGCYFEYHSRAQGLPQLKYYLSRLGSVKVRAAVSIGIISLRLVQIL